MAHHWTMRDKLTGETRSGVLEYEWHKDGSDFWWREGNMACDANRADTFYGSREKCPGYIAETEDEESGVIVDHECDWMPDRTQRFELLHVGPKRSAEELASAKRWALMWSEAFRLYRRDGKCEWPLAQCEREKQPDTGKPPLL